MQIYQQMCIFNHFYLWHISRPTQRLCFYCLINV